MMTRMTANYQTQNPTAIAHVRATIARVGVLAIVALFWPQVAVALAADALQGQRSGVRTVLSLAERSVSAAADRGEAFDTCPQPVLVWALVLPSQRSDSANPCVLRTGWTNALAPPHGLA